MNTNDPLLDSGLYFSGGEATGIDYGPITEFGFCSCTTTYDVYGSVGTLSLSSPLIGIDLTGDLRGAPWMLQVGPGTYGATYSEPFTYPITYRVVRDGVKSIFNSYFSD